MDGGTQDGSIGLAKREGVIFAFEMPCDLTAGWIGQDQGIQRFSPFNFTVHPLVDRDRILKI
ncbi:hypothetical protein N7488_005720 [Penicillium malachiteum]|nr:hypothetical protein N7488_005720 [Penicillium malachiteum]